MILIIKSSETGKAENNIFRHIYLCGKTIKNNKIMVNTKYRIMVYKYVGGSIRWRRTNGMEKVIFNTKFLKLGGSDTGGFLNNL